MASLHNNPAMLKNCAYLLSLSLCFFFNVVEPAHSSDVTSNATSDSGVAVHHPFSPPGRCNEIEKRNNPGLSCLRVIVTGFESASGVVRLSLYDRKESYDMRQHSCRHAVIPVKRDARGRLFAEKIFCGLKPGWYAILLFHDSDNNNKFDMFMGIPLERFGFSQNVTPGITGAPSFKETRFWLEPGKCHTVEIRLQSFLGS